MTKASSIRKVVIPAAGLGTRFLPASKVTPKELFPIVDRPLLQLNIDEVVASGIEEVILVVSPRKYALMDYFEPDTDLMRHLEKKGQADLLAVLQQIQQGIKVTEVIQEEALGLGHAVLMAREAVGDESFAVLLPDDLVRSEVPCLQQMMSVWDKEKLACVALRRVPTEQVTRYGIVDVTATQDRVHQVKTVVEKPAISDAPSDLAIVGRYLLPSKIFDSLERLTPGAVGEIQLTDALQELAQAEGLIGYEFSGEHYDAGNPLGYATASLAYGLAHPDIGEGLRDFIKENVQL